MRPANKIIIFILLFLIISILLLLIIAIFFDQAIITRKGTFFKSKITDKVVALTFDDGPSPVWTPAILDELQKAQVKATFFLLGEHVEKYPQITKRIIKEGHEIGNHTYDHKVLIYYKMNELEKEIKDTERIIKEVTGKVTKYFRPPKAWLTEQEKSQIKAMGYKIVLWSLNSKDWVTFDDKYIIKYIARNIKPGEIILFHDSGGVFSEEGGDRSETVKTIPGLVKKLEEKGYRFVTISQLVGNND